MGSEKQVVKQQIPNCQEKVLLSEKIPVPKPTQVGKERILRRAEEPLLRNSAKWPRNFGRRGADFKSAAVNRPKQLFIKNTALC